MKRFNGLVLVLFTSLVFAGCGHAQESIKLVDYQDITTGSQQFDLYLPLLQNQRVALVANAASRVGEQHLVDTLLTYGIRIEKIFCPEHGFRGNADAGELINDGIDPATGIPLISLYGNHKKPTPDDLKDIDWVVFDLQDVGVRFYTYVSTMTYVMEACADNGVSMMILDRPNPNGYLIDGPILDTAYSSFVGLHPVPIADGMTLGEYARMVIGERWINKANQLKLQVIPMAGYTHNMVVKLAVKPSPNLPNWQSVYLYPSLCLFEGTQVSIGRGTTLPFQIYGSPDMFLGSFMFTPQSIPGMSLHPKFEGQQCNGQMLTGYAENLTKNDPSIQLTWLITAYQAAKDKKNFFTNYFEKLAGTDLLRQQIIEGMTEEEIKASWKPGLDNFRLIRDKYVLYP